jgi:hypothetical protein
VRTKTIILGAIAALALATLTANAGATHQVPGSLVSLVAATTTVATADREAASTAAPSATHDGSSEAVQKAVAARPARITVPPACQDAIKNLKALHQADVTEDAAERAAARQPPSASALEADKAEDAAEKQQWRTALLAARAACLPQPSGACQAAIVTLQALKGTAVEDLREWTDLRTTNWPAQLASLRTAVGAVATACGDRD